MGLIRKADRACAGPHQVVTDLQTAGFGLAFSIEQLKAGETRRRTTEHETAWLMMQGELHVEAPDVQADFQRSSLFDELPHTLHVSAGTEVTLTAHSPVQLCCFEVENAAAFAARLIGPEQCRNERRGEGQLKDASFRFVRTLIDDVQGPPEAQLVLGEVVNMPGRWSSYPPHHHNQPEIYHYRFTEPQGYGHAEEGEQVYKVHDGDTLLIEGGRDHSQCAAPGYGMWYAWAIRHLPEERYAVPEFTEAHRWTMQPDAKSWWPSDED